MSREVWFVSWWLRVLLRVIKSKRPGILLDEIILLHDNALPHTANLVRDKLQRYRRLAAKDIDILHTAQIFPLVTSTVLAT